jgi:hypothetical protein
MLTVPEAWMQLVGESLAKAALNVAGLRELKPGEKLGLDSLCRLAITGGLQVVRQWPYANEADDELRAACFWIFWFELGRGYRPLNSGEILAIPVFGWRRDDWGALPLSPIVRRYFDLETKNWWAIALNPFDARPFDIELHLGRRSPHCDPAYWRGPSYVYLAYFDPPIRKPRPLRRRGFRIR